MKKFLADTNIYLRFVLEDNKVQAETVKKFLEKAKKRQLKIIFLSPVILEMEFVLRSVYSVPRKQIAKYLLALVKTDYLEIESRKLWIDVLETYSHQKISLFDLFLFFRSQEEDAEVLSFDKDFKKLARTLK